MIKSQKIPKRGRLGHVDHIPGGKRFWKVGRVYQTQEFVSVCKVKIELIEADRKLHRRTNVRWSSSETVARTKDVFAIHRLEKDSIFILLANPDYKTIQSNVLFGFDNLFGNYQLKILCNEKILWLCMPINISPRHYCFPIK